MPFRPLTATTTQAGPTPGFRPLATTTPAIKSQPPGSPTPTPGLFDRFKTGMQGARDQRATEINNAEEAYAKGEQGVRRTLFQIGGQLVGGAADPFVEGAKAALGAPTIKKVVNEGPLPLKNVVKPLGDAFKFATDKLSDTKLFREAADAGPELPIERDLKAVNEYLNLAPGPKGLRTVARGATDLTTKATTKIPKPETLVRNLQTKTIDDLEQSIRDATDATIVPRKTVKKSEARGKDPVRFLAEDGIVPTVKDGKMQTIAQADKLHASADPLNHHLDLALDEVERSVQPTPLATLRTRAIKLADDTKGITETARKSIKDDINQEFDLQLQAGRSAMTLRELNAFKKTQYGATNKYDALKPYKNDAHTLMARAAKDTIEDTVPAEAFSVKELNSHIGDIYDAEKLLRTLDTRAVKGGRLGKYTGRIVGGIIGGNMGGPLGTFFGTVGGDVVMDILQRTTFSNPLKQQILRNLQRTDPEAYTKAMEYMKKAGLERETRPLLPAPSGKQSTINEGRPMPVLPTGGSREFIGRDTSVGDYTPPSGGAGSGHKTTSPQVLPKRKASSNATTEPGLIEDTTNFLKKTLKDAQPGLSMKAVNQTPLADIHPDDLYLMHKFIDHARIKGPLSDGEFAQVEKLAQHFDISMDKGLGGVANAFDQILTGARKAKGTVVPNRDDLGRFAKKAVLPKKK